MANELTPYFEPADNVTALAEAAVTGKRFVAISGPMSGGRIQVSPAGAAPEKLLLVACYDAAAGGDVAVQRTGIVPVTAGAAISAGDMVTSDAAGKAVVAAAGEVAQGEAMDDAALNADLPVLLHPVTIPV